MLPLLFVSLLLFVLLAAAVISMLTAGVGNAVQDSCGSARRISKGSAEVEDAFGCTLACCPEYATALLEARSPCVLLLARAASGDLDAMTNQIVDHLRSHIPALVAAHLAAIERAQPGLRRQAMADLVEDLRNMAAVAQGRLDFLAARRSEMRRTTLPRAAAA